MTRDFAISLLALAPTALIGQVSSSAIRQPVASTAAPADRPVARVNGAILTDRDLLREMYTIFPYARQHNGGVPKAMEAQIRNGAMKMIVFEELVYQEAQRRKINIAPAKLNRAVLEFIKQFPSQDAFDQFMKTELNGSQELLRSKVRRSLLIEEILDSEVRKKSVVTDADVRAFYDQHPDNFKIPESYAIQTISVLPPPNATAAQLKDVKKRADDAIRQAKATKNYEEFGVLAERISEDDYHVMMGDHRAVDIAKIPPEILPVVKEMQTGQVSGLISVGQAYCIVRLNAHVPEGKQKFDDVKGSLRDSMQKNKTEQVRSAFDKKLRTTAKIEVL